jgi:MFS family permease
LSTKPPVFYGWVVVAACFATTFCVGEVMWSFGVFFTSLEQEFDWSRSVVSAGYTFLILGHSASTIVAGRLADRNSARPVLLVSAALAGVAIALCSQIHNATQFYVLFFLAGLGTGATFSVPISTVQRWFENRPHSGTALATVMAGVGMGGLVCAPLFRYLIAGPGWRPTIVFAGATFLLIIGGAGMLKRPYAGTGRPESDRTTQQREPASALPARKLVLTRQFLVLLSVTFVASLSFQVLSVHLVPYATDIGVSAKAAAVALGLIGGASVPGRFLSGVLSERLGWSGTLVGALLGTAATVACLMLISHDWTLLFIVALFGVCHGTRAVAVIGLLGRVFGTGSLGELIGITIALAQLLSAPGPYIVGYWFDLGHSYTSTFAILSLGLALGALLVLRLGSTGPLSGVCRQDSSLVHKR